MPVPRSSTDIIDGILAREGGDKFTDDPKDPGGATKYGVTGKALAEWRKKPVTSADVRDLTEKEAREIYLHMYILEAGLDKVLNLPLRELLVDCAVNNGRGRAVRWLQEALGAQVDGALGPKTLGLLAQAYPYRVYYKVCGIRLRAYGVLVEQNHELVRFVAGWINRTCSFLELGYGTS